MYSLAGRRAACGEEGGARGGGWRAGRRAVRGEEGGARGGGRCAGRRAAHGLVLFP